MSYCRWSTDNFGCDLYCYEDVAGGYTTHVAGNRIVGDVPKIGEFPLTWNDEEREEYEKRCLAQMRFLQTCERKPIGLPYDGQSFNDSDLESFLERLLHLREVGYKFPDRVIDAVKEELNEQTKEA